MKYRADIDGLRAIAVLFVLMFHGGLSFFPSGFIGVDIFFVISGFLITSIITKSIKDHSFSLADFYVRRLWRLQPALIAVIIFTLVLAVIFYLPNDFIEYTKSARYTTLFTSNQYFERSTTGYAAPDAAYLLLLHTWSLSIEWQWYLLLPAGILILHRFLPYRYLALATILLALCMLVVSLYLSDKYPNKSYYFLSSRVFEFMIGSIIAILNQERFKPKARTASILGLLSFGALIFSATRTDIILGYPNYYAVIVSVATATLIFIGSSCNSFTSRALSLTPLVFIGSISYSLYLWHWPIFSIGRYLGLTDNLLFKAGCFILTFIAAYLSYIFIEKPFRKKRISIFKSVLILVLIPAIVFLLLHLVNKKHNGFSSRFGAEYSRIENTLKEHKSPHRQSCLNGNTDGKDTNCIIGERGSNKKALLIGDSHSNHFWSFFDVLANDARISMSVQGTSSCLALPDIYLFDWWYFKNKIYQECHDNTVMYYKNIENGKFDYVIIGELWMNYAHNNIINRLGDERSIERSRARYEVALRKALDVIIHSGAKPVIIKSIYSMPPNYMSCFYQKIKLRETNTNDICSFGTFNGDSNHWDSQLFDMLKVDYPSLVIIDPKDVQCHGDKCKTSINGIPVYRDVGHITDYASYEFAKEYLKRFENPLK